MRYDNRLTTSYYKRYKKQFSTILGDCHFLRDQEECSALVVESRLNDVNELKEQGYK